MSDACSTSQSASDASETAKRMVPTLAGAHGGASRAVEMLAKVHEARLSSGLLTPAALKSQLKAGDPRMVAAPAVKVAEGEWAPQGRVVDAQMQPVVSFTVFLVDVNKDYVREYSFACKGMRAVSRSAWTQAAVGPSNTNAGASGTPALFVEVEGAKGTPVYMSSTPFAPTIGASTYLTNVRSAGGQLIVRPPLKIPRVEMPSDAKKT